MSARRLLGAIAAAALLATGVPAPVYAQVGCLPAGAEITPVPWEQLLLAPERVWPLSTGAGQRVAVVSTGIAPTPYLPDGVAGRTDLAPDDGRDPSGERDCLGVGTGVAGIIAAPETDGVGFHGVAPAAQLLDAKVVGDRFESEPAGTVAPERLARGIDWAVGQDATVIVVPTITHQDSDRLQEAVAQAVAAGVVVVASVGDADQAAGEPVPAEQPGAEPYPAAYDGVIGVAAIDQSGVAGLSHASHVDLVAPGSEILTIWPNDGLGYLSGTGFAAAYVAGSVALVRAYRPELAPDEVARVLFATASPAAEAAGSARYGFGIVDPYLALVAGVADGEPADPPPYAPAEASAEELARQRAQERGDALATRLAAVGLALAAAVAAAVGFGSRGRRRRWRTGLATVPPEPPEADRPEPPRDLLSDVGNRS